ncbi:hypothetical protein QVG61_01155 [Thiohalobacter sp. IOR34]|uniref:hypothetical protein n=1 Tax=Thiohalobacter sp. IOR34 TaxID=3057176 RepID=UPI0025AEF68A|nr:hypothetical protein [Thiohalobacter sp. IOR34]WJW75723.1 hypothetical protein QVG61_01155 [Thiohalobacter sp. IOR34]
MTDSAAPVQLITGRSARNAAALFNWGNIVSLLLPFPLLIFWLGASMFVYAMNRHHPNPKVGHYTQQAAYRFYGITGFFVAAAMFLPVDLSYYLIAWALAALILLPWSIRDLLRIYRDSWEDQRLLREVQA